jgi:hypothetical protein
MTNAYKLLQILFERFQSWMVGVQTGKGKLITVLVQIIADRNLYE